MSMRIFLIAFTVIVSATIICFALFGIDPVLRRIWHIHVMNPRFADLQSIAGALKSITLGHDPYLSNPGDPWNRLLNYPRITITLAKLVDLNPQKVVYLGLISIGLYITGFLVFCRQTKIGYIDSIVLACVFFSPMSVLAMERGNSDLLVFFILSLSITLLNKPIYSVWLILIAVVLKLYPIFVCSIFYRFTKNKTIIYMSMALLAFLVYLWFNIEDLLLIKNNTPIGQSFSYGSIYLNKRIFGVVGGWSGQAVTIAVFCHCVLLYMLICSRVFSISLLNENSVRIDFFRGGSCVYIATFMLASNWDYRMIFLLFCLPQLVTWSLNSSDMFSRFMAKISITTIIFNSWYLFFKTFDEHFFRIAHDVSSFLLFSALFVLFVTSLPQWMIISPMNNKSSDLQRDNSRKVD